MHDLYYLPEKQFQAINPYFSLSHGVSRVDDLRVISGIIHVLKRGLQWRDAPREYGPHKTLYNRFIRWINCHAPNTCWLIADMMHWFRDALRNKVSVR